MIHLPTALAAIACALVLAGGLSACSPLTALNVISPGNALRASDGVPYGTHARHKLDIYTPKGANAASPVIVFFYGGNWVSGERAAYAFVGRALAARGFVVVIPDYRLYPEVRYPDFLDDGARAVAWTAREIARYGGDPSRLFVMGHSAGAYNAAMLALDERYLARHGLKPGALRGWIGLAGPYDFLPVENKTMRPVFHFPDTPLDSQPIRHVSAASPPALLIAANKDSLVNPQRNTGGLANQLRAHRVPVREVYFDGVNHVTLVASLAAPLRALAPTLEAVDAFVRSDGGRHANSP